jgi:hypothetical protein
VERRASIGSGSVILCGVASGKSAVVTRDVGIPPSSG